MSGKGYLNPTVSKPNQFPPPPPETAIFKSDINSGPVASRCYAFMESDGAIDVDSIAKTEDAVRWKVLKGSMGWRFDHPERYNRDEEWRRLLAFGKVVPVSVSVENA